MPETGDLTYNKDMLNVEQPNGSITITKDHIQTYCDATGHPISQDESGRIEVPVNMLNVFFNRSVQIGSDVKLEGASVGLNAGRSIEVFDQVFEGDTLEVGQKSLAINVRLQPTKQTLTEAEIEDVSGKIVAAVEKATGGRLRT